jgi:hypothetical protein
MHRYADHNCNPNGPINVALALTSQKARLPLEDADEVSCGTHKNILALLSPVHSLYKSVDIRLRDCVSCPLRSLRFNGSQEYVC